MQNDKNIVFEVIKHCKALRIRC